MSVDDSLSNEESQLLAMHEKENNLPMLGIDSVMCPLPQRTAAWQRITTDLPLSLLDAMTTVIPLRTVPEHAAEILKGRVRGRLVVDVNQ